MNLTEKQHELVRQIAKLFNEAEDAGLFLVQDIATDSLLAYNIGDKELEIRWVNDGVSEGYTDISDEFENLCELGSLNHDDMVLVR